MGKKNGGLINGVVSILLSRFPDYLKKCSYYVDRRSVKNNSNDFLIICDKSKL